MVALTIITRPSEVIMDTVSEELLSRKMMCMPSFHKRKQIMHVHTVYVHVAYNSNANSYY